MTRYERRYYARIIQAVKKLQYRLQCQNETHSIVLWNLSAKCRLEITAKGLFLHCFKTGKKPLNKREFCAYMVGQSHLFEVLLAKAYPYQYLDDLVL